MEWMKEERIEEITQELMQEIAELNEDILDLIERRNPDPSVAAVVLIRLFEYSLELVERSKGKDHADELRQAVSRAMSSEH